MKDGKNFVEILMTPKTIELEFQDALVITAVFADFYGMAMGTEHHALFKRRYGPIKRQIKKLSSKIVPSNILKFNAQDFSKKPELTLTLIDWSDLILVLMSTPETEILIQEIREKMGEV